MHPPPPPAKVVEVIDGWPRIPDFMVLGAMKAGTTSLHGYLRAHPNVWMNIYKRGTSKPNHTSYYSEVHFWDDCGTWKSCSEEMYLRHMSESC